MGADSFNSKRNIRTACFAHLLAHPHEARNRSRLPPTLPLQLVAVLACSAFDPQLPRQHHSQQTTGVLAVQAPRQTAVRNTWSERLQPTCNKALRQFDCSAGYLRDVEQILAITAIVTSLVEDCINRQQPQVMHRLHTPPLSMPHQTWHHNALRTYKLLERFANNGTHTS